MPSAFPHRSMQQILAHYQVNHADSQAIYQAVLVTVPTWNTSVGQAVRIERKGQMWHTLDTFPVVIGRNGMKWGIGLHQISEDHAKKEGDGCSPAGIFDFGTAFGQNMSSSLMKWPFRTLNHNDRYVDDSQSSYYNQWVDVRESKKEWDSAEVMLRPDGLYNRGLVIQHNMNPVTPAAGSAIFFHIWRNSSSSTGLRNLLSVNSNFIRL